MVTMTRTAEPLTVPQLVPGMRLTLDEFASLGEIPREDGLWELLDGVLVVASPPADPHAVVVVALGAVLLQARPDGLAVLGGGNGVIGGTSGLGPDLSVKRVADLGDRRAVPLLVVEVASPSTRSRDRNAKRRIYASLGVASYWLVDPDVPRVLVLELGADGAYVDVAELTGDERVTVASPFPVTLCPAELVRP